MENIAKRNTICNTCTLKLVVIAYQRRPLFRLLREPLNKSMWLLARIHRIRSEDFIVRTTACYGCMRFQKVALKEKSALFRWLNAAINPFFDRILAGIVHEQEMITARDYARRATLGDISNEEATEWMDRLNKRG